MPTTRCCCAAAARLPLPAAACCVLWQGDPAAIAALHSADQPLPLAICRSAHPAPIFSDHSQYFPENPPARATFAVKVRPSCLLSRFVLVLDCTLGVGLHMRLVDTAQIPPSWPPTPCRACRWVPRWRLRPPPCCEQPSASKLCVPVEPCSDSPCLPRPCRFQLLPLRSELHISAHPSVHCFMRVRTAHIKPRHLAITQCKET